MNSPIVLRMMPHLMAVGYALLTILVVERFAFSQGYAPDVAVQKMETPQGLRVRLVASEPVILQPNTVKCDDRGRLWVIQYLQYPNPAGLTRVKVDRWSRTVYDRIPEPPPHGPRGADKITILSDFDAEGKAQSHKDFIDGLNLATSIEFGHGGVYVLQVPYLLFYPDRDRDDVPDSDPEVLLEGFGMEDAQSLANHLTWGPDGWLYGVNGSTTTGLVRGIEFQQGCWRYHPIRKEFELFCEGGGNVWGLTFDAWGNLFYSTNANPFVHGLQGAYYAKNFGKHGPLHNLFAYGWFDTVERDKAPVGPPTGGTIYLGDSFPEEYRDTFMSGDFLGHTASYWNIFPKSATVTVKYGGTILQSNDTWFGATDVCLSPDGSMYLCDFHDQRTAHPDPDANWDKTNGRVYKIEAVNTKPLKEFDIRTKTSTECVELLSHPNGWFSSRARVQLAALQDLAVNPQLRKLALQTDDSRLALQGLWSLYVNGGFDETIALELLNHPEEYIRMWTVRFLGDAKLISKPMAERLYELAHIEASPVVRCQLAASAKRLSAEQGLPIVKAILDRDIDDNDERIPWMLWWAMESKSLTDRDLVLTTFSTPEAWNNGSYRGNLRRLMRRYAADGSAEGYDACVALWNTTPENQRESMVVALEQGLSERSVGLVGVGQGGLFEFTAENSSDPSTTRAFAPLSPDLKMIVFDIWQQKPNQTLRLKLAVRAGIDGAYAQLLSMVEDVASDQATLLNALDILRELGHDDCIDVVLKRIDVEQPTDVLLAAIGVLGRFGNEAIGEKLLELYPILTPEVQSRVRDVLFSKPASSLAFVTLVEQKMVPPESVPIDQLRRLALHENEELNELVRKIWGNIQPGTPEEKLATMRRFNNDLRAASGHVATGKELFKKHCGTCHKLFGEGNTIGPDLTTTTRGNLPELLANIVDPSAVVRSQYMSYVVLTTEGVIYTGLISEQDAASVTLLDAKNNKTRIPKDQIDELNESAVSIMPEKLLEPLTPQERRDLFAYLQSNLQAGK
ncbi:MAG: c-type cytochrome [Planctomycetota bacterium]|nr:c-type cytochrome [Planctomycetota bacterium]MDA1211007.1 c-type cytochrome [Planctomycetota bacterium]